MLAIGLNRPDKRNAFTSRCSPTCARAYALLESDDTLRAGVLFAHGDHFTAGLDLVDVGPTIVGGDSRFPTTAGIRGGWTVRGPSRSSRRHTAGA